MTSGAWTARLLRNLGVRLPVYPVKGELFSVLSRRPLLNATLFSEGCYIVPKKGGRIIVGATMCEHSYDRFVSFEGIRMLMEKAKRLLPSIAEAEWETAWAGLRPQTPDGLPYMGEHPEIRGLYAAAGHFRNGILLSPLTGKWMADLVLGRGRNRDLPAELRLDRAMASVTGKEAESCT